MSQPGQYPPPPAGQPGQYPPPPAQPLSAWERYAQVLLLSNEFLFVVTLGASVSISIFKVGLYGGVGITIDFDLVDPDNDGKLYIDEIEHTGAATPLPYHTALGALGRHVAESSPDRYQPSNVTWALIEDVVGRVKKVEKREKQAARAIATIEAIAAA